jgi:hypothetical protein
MRENYRGAAAHGVCPVQALRCEAQRVQRIVIPNERCP